MSSHKELTTEQIQELVDDLKTTDYTEGKFLVGYAAIGLVAITWVADIPLVWQTNLTWVITVLAILLHIILYKVERK